MHLTPRAHLLYVASLLAMSALPAAAHPWNKEGDTLPVPVAHVGAPVAPGEITSITLQIGRGQWSGWAGATYGLDLTGVAHEVVSLACPATMEPYQTQYAAYCRTGLWEDGGEHPAFIMAVMVRNIGVGGRRYSSDGAIYAAAGHDDALHPLSLTSR